MTTRRHLLWTAGAGTTAVLAASLFPRSAPAAASSEIFEVSYSDAEWRARLTPEQYQILRKEGTERAGTSPLNKEHRAGTFACAGCALPDRKSTRLNSSHSQISYAVFCLKKKKKVTATHVPRSINYSMN